MLTRVKRGWELSEATTTTETMFLNRRALVKGLAAGSILAAGALGGGRGARAGFFGSDDDQAQAPDPTADLYPVPRNPRYTIERPLTDFSITSTYNNFYEFGSHKQIYRAAQALRIRPWTVTIDGMVEKPMTVAIDDLIRKMSLEERVYRHRCVEAWSMTIPWSGFSMARLVAFARPTSGAKYIEMETFSDPDNAPGQRQFWYPWPYIEGVTMAEAANELAFLVTGAYGKPMARQYGAPLRLALPWKYGFKHIKSIIRFTFTDKRPKSFWENIAGNEYGF